MSSLLEVRRSAVAASTVPARSPASGEADAAPRLLAASERLQLAAVASGWTVELLDVAAWARGGEPEARYAARISLRDDAASLADRTSSTAFTSLVRSVREITATAMVDDASPPSPSGTPQPRAATLVVGTDDGLVYTYRVERRAGDGNDVRVQVLAAEQLLAGRAVRHLVGLGDGRVLVAGDSGQIDIVNLAMGAAEPQTVSVADEDDRILDLALSPDDLLAVALASGQMLVFDVDTDAGSSEAVALRQAYLFDFPVDSLGAITAVRWLDLEPRTVMAVHATGAVRIFKEDVLVASYPGVSVSKGHCRDLLAPFPRPARWKPPVGEARRALPGAVFGTAGLDLTEDLYVLSVHDAGTLTLWPFRVFSDGDDDGTPLPSMRQWMNFESWTDCVAASGRNAIHVWQTTRAADDAAVWILSLGNAGLAFTAVAPTRPAPHAAAPDPPATPAAQVADPAKLSPAPSPLSIQTRFAVPEALAVEAAPDVRAVDMDDADQVLAVAAQMHARAERIEATVAQMRVSMELFAREVHTSMAEALAALQDE